MIIENLIIQDSLRQKHIVRQDTIKLSSDSSIHKNKAHSDSIITVKAVNFQPVVKVQTTDTISFCSRNSIADVTFYDSINIVTRLDGSLIQNFPFVFTDINRKLHEETKVNLIRHLKNGDDFPSQLFHYDWVLPILLLSAFIYGVIKAESGKFFQGILKFISFRGINESASRDIGAIFQWESTLFNLASFINISLFVFLVSLWYDVLPVEWKKFIYWLIAFASIISALTLRHLICIIIGNLSDEKEIFREYLIGIYQAYRLTGLFLLVPIVLILYTSFIPVNILIYFGYSLVALLYLIRVLRLFLIFINRHVSIFYLILYLCALEILPVVILVKYFTGLA